MDQELASFLEEVSALVDARLHLLVPGEAVAPVNLHSAIRWSLFAGGKRFRPALLFASGRAFRAEASSLLDSASAIEMIHTYSLIHDDLPAMDDDDLRRGRPACHKKFGEATAILAGDILQTFAFKAVSEDNLLAPEKRVRIISEIARAAGSPSGMVAGQQMDIDAEGKAMAFEEIEGIHRAKTGAMILASARIGAIIGGASETEIEAISAYARALGLLFQITDDLLDITQTTEMLGKTAGKDLIAEKATYPSIFGIGESRRLALNSYEEAIGAISGIGKDTSILLHLAGYILRRQN